MSNDFYERLLEQHGDSPKSLDWSEAGQQERFRVLHEVGIGNHDSVLDVGCGLGHFFRYFVSQGYRGHYKGADASRAMIDRCGNILGGSFSFLNALTDPLPTADFVVSSGMLNLVEWSNLANMRTLLRKCFDACIKGAAINMLSSKAPKKREGRFYYDPSWALDEALAITPYVTLRHDYRDNDFTLYLRRGPA